MSHARNNALAEFPSTEKTRKPPAAASPHDPLIRGSKPESDETHLLPDLGNVLRPVERRGRRFAGLARPAERLEPVLESRGHDGPEHLQRHFAVVLDVVLHEAA